MYCKDETFSHFNYEEFGPSGKSGASRGEPKLNDEKFLFENFGLVSDVRFVRFPQTRNDRERHCRPRGRPYR